LPKSNKPKTGVMKTETEREENEQTPVMMVGHETQVRSWYHMQGKTNKYRTISNQRWE
jgi:hypothetical protein